MPSKSLLAKYDARESRSKIGEKNQHLSGKKKIGINQDIMLLVPPEEGSDFQTFGHESFKDSVKKRVSSMIDYNDLSVPDLMVQVRRPDNKRMLGMDSSRH